MLNPIACGNDLETVYVAVMGRDIGLPCIDQVGECVRVELRVLRGGMQVGLDDQDHAKRMCEEPTFVPDICVLGVRMLNRHRADPFLVRAIYALCSVHSTRAGRRFFESSSRSGLLSSMIFFENRCPLFGILL